MTPERSAAMQAFLTGAGWGDALRRPLAGDASNRRYERLTAGQRHAVLMDAPADRGEDIRPFIAVTQRLLAHGLSAPQIYASDPAAGLLLLEDLGDGLLARVARDTPALEPDMYAAATDVLIHLHHAGTPADLNPYGPAQMGDLAALAAVWYAPDPALAATIAQEVARLAATLPQQTGLIQRDYHAENLLWLPDRTGLARIGLLDYQDAMTGTLAYDLVSLLHDARRDVSQQVQTAMIARFAAGTGTPQQALDRQMAICGAQRNLRILGVFARLWLRDGKAGYLPLIPRVWGHVQTALRHPDLAALRALCMALPAPDDATLAALRARR
jgi:aminoglycoside/choline kinase family phosphotransferase